MKITPLTSGLVRASILLAASAVVTACSAESAGSREPEATTSQKLAGDLTGWAYYDGAAIPADRSYNSTGAANSLNHVVTGRYAVTFPNLGAAGIEGNVQVTAAGGGNERCTINDWFQTGNDIEVDVGCHTPAGAWSDSPFVVSFAKFPGGTAVSADGAYLRTQPGGATLSAGFQWGAAISESHIATGHYEITLGGIGTAGGSVVVTSYGWTTSYCKVGSWSVVGSDTKIDVRCFAPGGAPDDAGFSLRYIRRTRDSKSGSGGFVWANLPTTTDYTPFATYQQDRLVSECGDQLYTNVAHRVAAGRYQVTYPNQETASIPTGAVLVTAYGTGSEYCKLTNWEAPASAPGAVRTGTRCWDASGALVDTRFTQIYFSQNFWIC